MSNIENSNSNSNESKSYGISTFQNNGLKYEEKRREKLMSFALSEYESNWMPFAVFTDQKF